MADAPAPAPTPPVTHHADARRFVADTSAGQAVLAYETLGDGALDLQHTVVPEDARGDGVGDALVRAAVAHARGAGVRLVPTCPFVEAWMRRHPAERDVFADVG